jgi:ribosomal-protein-alanine N-acetyltransferase
MKLNSIEGFVETENFNCKNAMSKLDFVKEKTMKNYKIKNGKSISFDLYIKRI